MRSLEAPATLAMFTGSGGTLVSGRSRRLSTERNEAHAPSTQLPSPSFPEQRSVRELHHGYCDSKLAQHEPERGTTEWLINRRKALTS